MVKIEVKIVDGNDGQCKVNVGKTNQLKSATDNEKIVANQVHNAITNALKELNNN